MMAFRVLLLLMLFGLLPAQSQAGGPDHSTQQDGVCLSDLAIDQLSEFLADMADRINHQEARLLAIEQQQAALPEALKQAVQVVVLQTMKQQGAELMQELAVMLKAWEVEWSMKQGPKAPSAMTTGTTGTEASQEQGPERKQREYDPGFLTPFVWLFQQIPEEVRAWLGIILMFLAGGIMNKVLL